MNGLGLSAAALEQRRKYVQAGDAARIMAGEWRQVWREKMGLAQGDDLSGELRVQLGLFSEPFNLAWCEKQIGREVEYFSGSELQRHSWLLLTGRAARKDELQVSKSVPFMACNLDGMTVTARGERCVIDAKHVGRSDDPMVLRYTAAGTHQATVMDCDFWALSVLVGNGKWELIEQAVDPLYQAELIAREREFWGYVERGEEPGDRGDAVLAPKPTPKLRTILVPPHEGPAREGLLRENNWLAAAMAEAEAFIGTEAAAKRNNIARARLRDELIPSDVGVLEYGRFRAKRSKAGALALTVAKLEGDDGEDR